MIEKDEHPLVYTGAQVIAQALFQQNVKFVFGVVGVPVVEVADAIQQLGIKFIACRNEQTASYAACAYGYLTREPGVCLVVSGPGLVHALSGLANAKINAWPMLVLAGSSDRNQEGLGAFQEWPQVESVRMYTKYAARPDSLTRVPFFVERAFLNATYGRPGPCYLDIPGDMIVEKVPRLKVPVVPRIMSPPKSLAALDMVQLAINKLQHAKCPLIVIGKGAAYDQGCEVAIRQFVEHTNIPFLPTPMGKGVMSDTHEQCIASTRSLALMNADCIMLIGARMNWMLHFGKEPRFQKRYTLIQVDICAEEIGNFELADKKYVGLLGDISSVMKQMCDESGEFSRLDILDPWWLKLRHKMAQNRFVSKTLVEDKKMPMNYYAPLNEIKKLLPDDFVLVNEGANTMDIARTIIDQISPRSRLDSGTFSTMGLGLGYAIAAQLVYPNRRVVCIQGDSAFGFSGMDLETAVRYNLPIIFVIINNSGIYSGIESDEWKDACKRDKVPHLRATSLLPNTQYEKIAEAFGIDGYCARTPDEVSRLFSRALSKHRPSLINVVIETSSQRKKQQFQWLTRDEDSKL